MLEYFRSKKFRGASHHSQGWCQRSMMLTTVPPRGDRPEAWGSLHNPDCALPEEAMKYATSLRGRLQRVYPMCIQPHLFDLLYSLDGFSIYDCRNVPGIGDIVYARKGGQLPTYTHPDCNKSPASKAVSRHHYMMLIGPGGHVFCAAMKSATRLWPGKSIDDEHQPSKRQRTGDMGDSADCDGQQHHRFEYWWHLIPRHVDIDLQVEPADVTCQRLDTKTWLVRPPAHYCNNHTASLFT